MQCGGQQPRRSVVTSIPIPPLDVPGLLRKHSLRPQKGLGQNFLVETTYLERIVSVAEIGADDEVLEIGPGLGSLTRYLCRAAGRVVAVELDARIIPALAEVLKAFSNVEIVQGDILDVEVGKYFPRPGYLVVANIPYYITSALLRKLLEAPNPPNRLVLTVQKEVAQRICAQAGDLSLLALSVQLYGEPRIAASIPAGAFYPAPKVDSAVVRVDLFDRPRLPKTEQDLFFRLAKAGFGQKRKTLANTLSAGMGWKKAEAEAILLAAQIEPRRRAETVGLEEWFKLVGVVKSEK